ncbi:MAG: peroxide stress protein YaaA [Nitrincola lacisaponensis]|uniref:peroxide stress protein YaaA n=1 Tax=Nitrincola lacisaponensis TaxID=267850 RepID=UPI00391B3151
MLILISPAKTLDFDSTPVTSEHSMPEFTEDAARLIEKLREFAVQDIAELMKLSDKLASLNVARYASWTPEHTSDNARQALLAFRGDVYTGLDADSFSAADFSYAQQHLRILSGLYGVLKPLDLMQPYRLEMGTKLNTPAGNTLYQFWGDSLTERLNQDPAQQHNPLTINLASNEYFGAINPKKLQGTLISPVFKDFKNGQYKIISFYAKKARGLMSRYLIQNRIETLDDLLKFDLEGYYYSPEHSKPEAPVFLRDSAE